MSKEGLEVLARMTDSKIEIKDVIPEWLLLTYDLPHTDAGDQARAKFLKAAAAIGAVRHTDSVYLMPWSAEAESLALDLAKTEGGEVIVWSKAKPLTHEEQVLQGYDDALKPHIKEFSDRLNKMEGYLIKDNGIFARMVPKTTKMLDNLDAAILRRGNEVFALWFEILKERFRNMLRR